MTITCILAIAGFIAVIVHTMNKCPSWVPLVFISLAQVIHCLPLK